MFFLRLSCDGGVVVDKMPNYTGPYISNGEYQTSVEFGDVKPLDILDSFSRLHDSAYAKWKDQLHRSVADSIYNESVKNLEGLFPEIAGFAVLYGNQLGRAVSNIISGWEYAAGNPLGALAGGVYNLYELMSYTHNYDSVKREILSYYSTDPYKDTHQLGGGGELDMGNKPVVPDSKPKPALPCVDCSDKVTYNPTADQTPVIDYFDSFVVKMDDDFVRADARPGASPTIPNQPGYQTYNPTTSVGSNLGRQADGLVGSEIGHAEPFAPRVPGRRKRRKRNRVYMY